MHHPSNTQKCHLFNIDDGFEIKLGTTLENTTQEVGGNAETYLKLDRHIEHELGQCTSSTASERRGEVEET